MKTIQTLPDHIIAQIAAGEVIERPAYAVKELIDNAVDARATDIHIDISDSGLKKITVTDNGSGMSREDLVESYKLHTTSKVINEENLLAIKSRGFRGEALASIASISYMTIESKLKDTVAGTKIILMNGKEEDVTSIGMPIGTRVTVEQLFENVPARKKFLKSKTTELKQIVQKVLDQALATPEIGFHLSHNGKTMLDVVPHQTLQERIITLFGESIEPHLIPIQISSSYVKISGYIVTPQYSSQIIPKQYLAINGRPVLDKLLFSAIKNSYGINLGRHVQPSWFLSIDLPYEAVDVNIHPRKEYVQFIDHNLLIETICEQITNILQTNNVSYSAFATAPNSLVKETITTTYIGNNLKHTVLPWNKFLLTNLTNDTIIQIHNVYLLTSTSTGLILIDQHAAHERILYEKFTQQYVIEKNKKISVPLSKAILLELVSSEKILLDEYMEELHSLGFRIEHFSGNTYNITDVPLIFKDWNIQSLINQLLSHFSDDTFSTSIDTQSKKLLAYLACRSAVKSGDPLSEQQMKDILKELENIPEAITCPHGRPLKIYISLDELDKMFKRK